eukprot:200668-Prymnesium_polylepis.1
MACARHGGESRGCRAARHGARRDARAAAHQRGWDESEMRCVRERDRLMHDRVGVDTHNAREQMVPRGSSGAPREYRRSVRAGRACVTACRPQRRSAGVG